MGSKTGVSGRTAVFMMYFLSIVAASVYGAQAQEASAPVPAQTPTTTASTTPSAASAASQAAGVNPGTYVIGAEDVLAINVWKEPDMSKTVPVRPDGMISLPLIGEIKAAGLTPLQLQDSIATAVKRLISDPQVTVTVSEVHSQNFKIVGQVTKPGFYPLTRRITVLDAIALAGGFKDFAKTKKIYVLRTDASGKQVRLPFNYKQVIKGQHSDEDIALQPNDTVVVP